ncbi:MAG: HAD hydrolase-like protein, partial [Bacteroidota bacterium]
MKYELVLFDADGTLFDFEKASEEALKKAFHEFNIGQWTSETMRTYRKVNKQIWDEFELKIILADDLKTERFRRFFIALSVSGIDLKEFSEKYLLYLSQGGYLIDGAEELVKWCYGKFKLGIITNGLTSVQKPRFNNSTLNKYFEHYIISEEIGFAKPHAEIF